MVKRYESRLTGAMDVHKSLSLSGFLIQGNNDSEINQCDDVCMRRRIEENEEMALPKVTFPPLK